MELNKDIRKRDEIIFDSYEPDRYMGGVRIFKNLGLEKVKKLIELKFMDPEEQFNSCPSIGEFITFMEEYAGYTVSGYAVTDSRTDYSVVIDAISKDGELTRKEMRDLIHFAKDADEKVIEENHANCWWD